jgi:hypothetical protein
LFFNGRLLALGNKMGTKFENIISNELEILKLYENIKEIGEIYFTCFYKYKLPSMNNYTLEKIFDEYEKYFKNAMMYFDKKIAVYNKMLKLRDTIAKKQTRLRYEEKKLISRINLDDIFAEIKRISKNWKSDFNSKYNLYKRISKKADDLKLRKNIMINKNCLRKINKYIYFRLKYFCVSESYLILLIDRLYDKDDEIFEKNILDNFEDDLSKIEINKIKKIVLSTRNKWNRMFNNVSYQKIKEEIKI